MVALATLFFFLFISVFCFHRTNNCSCWFFLCINWPLHHIWGIFLPFKRFGYANNAKQYLRFYVPKASAIVDTNVQNGVNTCLPTTTSGTCAARWKWEYGFQTIQSNIFEEPLHKVNWAKFIYQPEVQVGSKKVFNASQFKHNSVQFMSNQSLVNWAVKLYIVFMAVWQ